MNPGSTRDAVLDIIGVHARLYVGIDGLDDDADLFAAGMTSFASVNVMLALEDLFDIEFPDAMLGRDAFASVSAIVASVDSILGSD